MNRDGNNYNIKACFFVLRKNMSTTYHLGYDIELLKYFNYPKLSKTDTFKICKLPYVECQKYTLAQTMEDLIYIITLSIFPYRIILVAVK